MVTVLSPHYQVVMLVRKQLEANVLQKLRDY